MPLRPFLKDLEMTNAELIAKIKAEIERRLKKYATDVTMPLGALGKVILELKGILSFLSTLESNEPTLTWGDVQLLDTFILELASEEREGKDWGESEEFYTEVLRRYNDFTKRTIPEIVSKIHEYNENDRKDSPEN